jgi:hypothetical protein
VEPKKTRSHEAMVPDHDEQHADELEPDEPSCASDTSWLRSDEGDAATM